MEICKIEHSIRWCCDRDTTDLEMTIFRLMPEIKQLLDIDYIHVDKENRNKFVGTKSLKRYCESRNNELMLFISGALIDEYKVEPFDFQYKEILDKLDNFLINVGFIKISKITKLLEFNNYEG